MKRVLVVEDNKTNRYMITFLLGKYGYTVIEAGDGKTGIELAVKEKPDLIIMDIQLPDINGLELIRFIRDNDRYKKTPLIIVSTESSQRDRERGLALGANSYLVKPFTPAALKETVERYLKDL